MWLTLTFLTIYKFCESDIDLHLIIIFVQLYVTDLHYYNIHIVLLEQFKKIVCFHW
jgi:hypothetical protein